MVDRAELFMEMLLKGRGMLYALDMRLREPRYRIDVQLGWSQLKLSHHFDLTGMYRVVHALIRV